MLEGKFTLSYHFFDTNSDKNHFDLFLEQKPGDRLIHYTIHRRTHISPEGFFYADLGSPHRPIYLDFEGKISNNRGRVRIFKKGVYEYLNSDEVKTWKKKIKICCQKATTSPMDKEECGKKQYFRTDLVLKTFTR